MPPQIQKPDPGRKNQLLASLGPEDYSALTQAHKVIGLKYRQRLYRRDYPIEFVYFPIDCMVSLLVSEKDKPSIEMATIGREGVVGATELLQQQGAMGLCIVQLPGTAVRISAAAFLKASGSPNVQDLMYRHLSALMRQVMQKVACNHLHSMEERCARWLLMTHDRAGRDEFPLTQARLAQMLGVRRATVNLATGMLKKAGLIRYVRGRITIVDRRGLESTVCKCYELIRKAYRSILPCESQTGLSDRIEGARLGTAAVIQRCTLPYI